MARPYLPLWMTLSLLLTPTLALAKVAKPLEEELTPYVTKFTATSDLEPQAKQAALMTWGVLADPKAAPEIEPFKADESPAVRLGAGLGLMLAGQKGADEFVVSQLQSQGPLLPALRGRIAALQDGRELGVIDALLGPGTKPEDQAQVLEYLSLQSGPLLERLHDIALATAFPALQQPALDALTKAARPASLKVASTLLAEEAKAPASGRSSKKKRKKVAKDAPDAPDTPAAQPPTSAPKKAALALALAIAQAHPNQRAQVIALLRPTLPTLDPATRIDTLKSLLAFHDVATPSLLLKEALATSDDATRTDLLLAVRDAVAQHQVKPAFAEVKPLLGLKDLSEFQRALVYQLAAASGQKATHAELLKFFVSRTFEERLIAAQALPYTGDPGVVELLSKSLFEGDRRMRLFSAEGLGVLADPKGLGAMQSALNKDKDPEIRALLLTGVGRIPTPEAARLLRFQVRGATPAERKLIVQGIRRHNLSQGLDTLQQLKSDRDEEVRWQAFLATLQLDPKQAEPLFPTMFRSPPPTFLSDLLELPPATQDRLLSYLSTHTSSLVRPPVIDHLTAHPDRHRPLLRKLLAASDTRPDERLQIMRTLARDPQTQDISLIESLARDTESKTPELRHEAAWSLAKVANPQMEATFRGLMSSPDPVVQSLAIFSLASIHDTPQPPPKKRRR